MKKTSKSIREIQPGSTNVLKIAGKKGPSVMVNKEFFRPMPSIFIKILTLLGTFLKRLEALGSQARETDEQIRKLRSEHYAKYGFYFRDRF